MDNNMYVVVDAATSEAVVIDPGFGSEQVLDAVISEGLKVTHVLNTHAHLDHVAENARFVEALGCGLGLHPSDLPLMRALSEQAAWFGVAAPKVVEPTLELEEGKGIKVGRDTLQVLHTPGHTPGHVCFFGPKWLIVGDVIFAGSIGRTDLPGGDHAELMRSINRHVLSFADAFELHPGHGPSTTVGRERRTNPFLTEGAPLCG